MLVNKDYIGDHCLLIANEIIENNNKLEKEILEIITNNDTGILYHTSLKTRLYEDKYDVESVYEKLLSKIKTYTKLHKRSQEKSVVNEDIEISQYFKGFNISLYNQEGCLFRKIITKSRATYIRLDSKRYDLALNSSLVNKEFSLRIAGEILLEAKDKNSDFLIVKDTKYLEIFDGMQSKIEKVVNREINLPIITQAQFEMLLVGEQNISKLGFSTHKVKLELLDK
jgi:heterodisulfide reductase subunit B